MEVNNSGLAKVGKGDNPYHIINKLQFSVFFNKCISLIINIVFTFFCKFLSNFISTQCLKHRQFAFFILCGDLYHVFKIGCHMDNPAIIASAWYCNLNIFKVHIKVIYCQNYTLCKERNSVTIMLDPINSEINGSDTIVQAKLATIQTCFLYITSL